MFSQLPQLFKGHFSLERPTDAERIQSAVILFISPLIFAVIFVQQALRRVA